MSMESLGGIMPAGRPVGVSSLSRSHVFAIAAGGGMNHWMSTSGGPWSRPTPLPGGNLVPSFPCAIALPDGTVHVFAITNQGAISHWSSADGNIWNNQVDARAPIPGGGNGLAAASMGGQRIDVFATSAQGIVQYSFNGNQVLAVNPFLPDSGFLPTRLLTAVSSGPGNLDVFAVDPNIRMPLHWHFNGTWSKQIIGGALHSNTGLAAVSVEPGHIELFGMTADKQMAWWTLNGQVFTPRTIPHSPWSLPDGMPAVIAGTGGRLDLFAIGQGDPLKGGPLVHWRYDGGNWRDPIAYDGGIAAGGVSAIKGMGGLEAFGFQSGNNNCLLHWPAGIAATEHNSWRNWAGNRQTNLEGHCYPQDLEELVAVVKTAARQNKRVRAVGSSWSFSDIAMTPGYLVETSKLCNILNTVLPTARVVRPIWIGSSPGHLIHVEAGIVLEDLMGILDKQGMAPGTMGGAAGQTLAGVISTSVHGSHFRLPPIPDWVRAIHLIGPDGRQYWLEPKDRPITKEAELQLAVGPDVEIKRDDDWFDSVLVTVGSLGIVYSVIIEVKDAYKLRETRTAVKWSELRKQVADGSIFTDGAPDGVQIAIDPGSMGHADGDPDCFLSSRNTVAMSEVSNPENTGFDPQASFCEGDHILEIFYRIATPVVYPTILTVLGSIPGVAPLIAPIMPMIVSLIATDQVIPILYNVLEAAGPGSVGDLLGMVLDQHPDLTSTLMSEITKSAQSPGVAVDLAHQIMARRNKGACIARGLALELAFDCDFGGQRAFIDAAIQLLQGEAAMGRYLGGWFAIRFVGQSRAILSPQRTSMTCMIEFVGLRTLSSTKPLLARLEALGREHDAIQHWGMFDDLTAADVARAYPRLNTWRKVRWELTNKGTVHTFDNDFTDRCGLSRPPTTGWQPLGGEFTSGPAVASWAPNRLDVFARGIDMTLYTSSWTGSAWNRWTQLAPNPIDSAPAAVARGLQVLGGSRRIDVFALGTDKQMYTMAWDGSQWSGWNSLGGEFNSGPAAAASGNSINVFARGTDNALYVLTGGRRSRWQQVAPEPIDSAPAAVAQPNGRVDVFALGTDKQMYTLSWNNSEGRWTRWSALGGQFLSGPAVSSWGPNRLDVFARGMDNALYTNSWNGTSWLGWHPVAPEPTLSEPAAVSWGANRIDLFARGTDNQIYTRLSDGS